MASALPPPAPGVPLILLLGRMITRTSIYSEACHRDCGGESWFLNFGQFGPLNRSGTCGGTDSWLLLLLLLFHIAHEAAQRDRQRPSLAQGPGCGHVLRGPIATASVGFGGHGIIRAGFAGPTCCPAPPSALPVPTRSMNFESYGYFFGSPFAASCCQLGNTREKKREGFGKERNEREGEKPTASFLFRAVIIMAYNKGERQGDRDWKRR